MINLAAKRFFQYALLGEELRLAEDVVLTIEDDLIVRIEENTAFHDVDEIYLDSLATPAFINAHTHLGDSVAKEAAWNATIAEAVGNKGIKFRKLREKASENPLAIKLTLREMAHCGVAAFADFREEGINGITLLKDQISDFPGKSIILGRPTTGMTDLLPVINNSDGLGIATTTYYSDEELTNIKTIAKQNEKLLVVHCAETKEERQLALERFGQNDVFRAIELLEADVLIHMTTATPKDLLLAKEQDVGVVFCPRSNAYFGTGFPPINEALSMGLLVALGTDNVMISHPDPLQEARWLALQLRLMGKTPNPQELLQLITVNPAKMFSLSSGILEVGKRANILGINLKTPRTSYCDDPILALLMRATPEDYALISFGDDVVYSENKRKSR
ncbi:MAG: amidohydrolase family protein [Candidatus Heimdallarchaeota archaeon]